VLNKRNFIDVLLPWVSAIVRDKEGSDGKGGHLKINLELLSSLLGCLVNLLSSEEGVGESLDYSQKLEVNKIYETLKSKI
jgi:hypothetical protein